VKADATFKLLLHIIFNIFYGLYATINYFIAFCLFNIFLDLLLNFPLGKHVLTFVCFSTVMS